MEKTILENRLAIESELVKDESMSVLKELEDIDDIMSVLKELEDICFNCNPFDDIESTEERSANCD